MRKVILASKNNSFLMDIATTLALDDDILIQLLTAKTYEQAKSLSQSNPDAIVAFSGSIIADETNVNFGNVEAYGYAENSEDIRLFEEKGIPYLGLAKTSSKLIEYLSAPSIEVVKPKKKNIVSTPAKTEPVVPANSVEVAQPVVEQPVMQQPQQPQAQVTNGFSPEQMAQMMVMMQSLLQTQQPASVNIDADTKINTKKTEAEQVASAVIELADPDEDNGIKETNDKKQNKNKTRSNDVETGGSRLRSRMQENSKTTIDKQIEEDGALFNKKLKPKTNVVTVYSAKGGVGKTTIAAETAVCLAGTSNGRRLYRVCIVDYNIDFGDVTSTLELDPGGVNMSYWASEIRELLSQGAKPETINYTRKEMEDDYLQSITYKTSAGNTKLYALVAPIAHEDSMDIHGPELEIMLRNIVEHGEFDFVVCDTGNNTRDSSIIATDMADHLLLVATQDVTTASCNNAVINTMMKTGFDVDKIRLIINNALPYRETGVSVQEVEETFPYTCICRIKRTPDIIKANNTGRPLVFNDKHEYTKQIRKIVNYVTTGAITEDDEPEKKGLLGIFKRKG